MRKNETTTRFVAEPTPIFRLQLLQQGVNSGRVLEYGGTIRIQLFLQEGVYSREGMVNAAEVGRMFAVDVTAFANRLHPNSDHRFIVCEGSMGVYGYDITKGDQSEERLAKIQIPLGGQVVSLQWAGHAPTAEQTDFLTQYADRLAGVISLQRDNN